MRRHAPFCKSLSVAVGKSCDFMDPGFACQDLDQALRGLGRSWRTVDREVLVDVVESASEDRVGFAGRDNAEVYRQLLMERL